MSELGPLSGQCFRGESGSRISGPSGQLLTHNGHPPAFHTAIARTVLSPVRQSFKPLSCHLLGLGLPMKRREFISVPAGSFRFAWHWVCGRGSIARGVSDEGATAEIASKRSPCLSRKKHSMPAARTWRLPCRSLTVDISSSRTACSSSRWRRHRCKAAAKRCWSIPFASARSAARQYQHSRYDRCWHRTDMVQCPS
jgi:hypothetical protein